jgi:hypothetical protein
MSERGGRGALCGAAANRWPASGCDRYLRCLARLVENDCRRLVFPEGLQREGSISIYRQFQGRERSGCGVLACNAVALWQLAVSDTTVEEGETTAEEQVQAPAPAPAPAPAAHRQQLQLHRAH